MLYEDRKKLMSILESFEGKDFDTYCDLRAQFFAKSFAGLTFPYSNAEILAEAEQFPNGKLPGVTRAAIMRKRSAISKEYGKAVADAALFPILKLGDIDEYDDVDNRVRSIVELGGINPFTGKKIPMKKKARKQIKKAVKKEAKKILKSI